ncbi:hypothetical protein M8C21_022609, partial [Ambrosia artemisiifolia]
GYVSFSPPTSNNPVPPGFLLCYFTTTHPYLGRERARLVLRHLRHTTLPKIPNSAEFTQENYVNGSPVLTRLSIACRLFYVRRHSCFAALER